MKYCDNCGNELAENSNFCSRCGKQISAPRNYIQNNGSSGTVVVCAIVGLLFPIIGAILYYVFKNTDTRAANTANACSWIGFLGQLLYFLYFGFPILIFF